MIEVFLCRFFWIEIFPTLFWGLVVCGTIIGSLCIICPLIKYHIDSRAIILDKQHQFEKDMKADAFEREKEWYFIKKVDQPFEEELKKYKEELTELKKKEEELNKGTDSLKNDKEQFEKEILMAKIKAYEEIIKTINK